MDLPEIALVNVLSRFPLKSIARFRLICKEWKSLLDSDFFRGYYISFNSSSSSSVSWSIIQTKPHKLSLEIVGHHGCDTWGLTRSPGSYLSFLVETTITKLLVLACTDGLVLIYAEAIDGSPLYYIGNPLFQEWFHIPLPSFLSLQDLDRLKKNERFTDTGLVTKMQSGIVVSYKIVWMLRPDVSSTMLDFMVYSSETGIWEKTQNVRCDCLYSTIWSRHDKSIALNGILHWLSQENIANDAKSVVAYDFYGGRDGDECRVIHFPGKDNELRRFRRTFTTSEGSIVYFNEFHENRSHTLRVWKLVKYTNGPEAWQLSWEINLVPLIKISTDYYFPVVMHPLNSEIIYLWSRSKKGLILFNLRTHVFSLLKETAYDTKCVDGCILSFNRCREYMEEIYGCYLHMHQTLPNHLFFSQYVLPRWWSRLPLPQPT